MAPHKHPYPEIRKEYQIKPKENRKKRKSDLEQKLWKEKPCKQQRAPTMINELLMRLIRKNKECTKTNIRNAKEHIATDPKHIKMI